MERINIGGMAEILKARDMSLVDEPIVAIKRVLPHLAEDKQFATMFLDESRVLAQLEHENVIRTLEVGQVAGTPFIALEFIWGQDARALFHRARRSSHPTPLAIGCQLIAEACGALHYAHELCDSEGKPLHIVHRDVSLQNILVSYDGAVKLTDFGIAMSAENIARTEVGIVKGKFGYMSPEQIMSAPMDRRSDIFAAGICLYELLTNERLFSGDSDYAAVAKVRNVAIDPPSRVNREIPSALEAVVMRALAKHPRDRFQDAAEMRDALVEFMAESRNECSATALAVHMRSVFAPELRRAPTPDALLRSQPPKVEALTGLAAFDHLDPVSTVSAAADVQAHARPSGDSAIMNVPPGIRLRSATVEDGRIAWNEDEVVTGAERIDPALEEEADENDVTRQLYVGETWSGVSTGAISGMRSSAPASAVGAPSPFDAPPAESLEAQSEDDPHSDTLQPAPASPSALRSYGAVVGIVVAIVAVIAGVLLLTRGLRPAAVHFAASPRDAEVRLDGQLLPMTASPFVIQDIEAGVSHRIDVSKTGYKSWSTQLSLASGQVLRLPLVTLLPDGSAATPPLSPPPDQPVEAATPEAVTPEASAPPPEPEASVPAQAPSGRRARAARRQAAASTESAAGSGILRINSRPWSHVSIDGRSIGNTPQMNIVLPAGKHTIKLANTEFGLNKTIKVRINPGQTVTQVVDLQ